MSPATGNSTQPDTAKLAPGSEAASPSALDLAESPPRYLLSGSADPSGNERRRGPALSVAGGSQLQPIATAQPADNQTVIPVGWRFTGELEAIGPVRILGRMEGTIRQAAGVAVVDLAPSGSVKGDIVGKDVQIRGTFDGNIDASGGSVTIEESAKVTGKVTYSQIRLLGGRHKIELAYADPDGIKAP